MERLSLNISHPCFPRSGTPIIPQEQMKRTRNGNKEVNIPNSVNIYLLSPLNEHVYKVIIRTMYYWIWNIYRCNMDNNSKTRKKIISISINKYKSEVNSKKLKCVLQVLE